MKYRADIDGLRALAVSSVVMYHAFPDLLPGGFVGVDVFFVISGYLITGIILDDLEAGRLDVLSFFARRVRRLFPALLLVITATLLAGWLILFPHEYALLGKHALSAAAFGINFVLAAEEGYFDVGAYAKPLLHLWSLAVEEQFYLVWPALLLLTWKWARPFSMVLIVFWIFSLFVSLYLASVSPEEAFFWPFGRFWELLTGAALVMLERRRTSASARHETSSWRIVSLGEVVRPEYRRNALSCLGLLAIGLSALFLSSDMGFPGAWAGLPVVGATLIMAAGQKTWLNRMLLSNRALVFVGLISYPLYLWHWPLFSFGTIVSGSEMAIGVRLALVAVSIILAGLTYRYIEAPIRHRPRSPVMALSAGMLLVGAFGAWVFLADGGTGLKAQTTERFELGHHECDGPRRYGYCVAGNPEGPRSILVYGDSHALHITESLSRRVGADTRITIIADGSCFMGTDWRISIKGDERFEQCQAVIEGLQREVAGKRYDLVITGQRWHAYGLTTAEQYEAAILDRLNNFGIEARKLAILGTTANVDFKCELSSFRTRFFSKDDCRVKDGSFESIKVFERVAGKFSQGGVRFFFPHAFICQASGCSAFVGRHAVYFDDHHLTVLGSSQMVAQIVSFLDE
ncbi:MAG: acyltransferase [Rhodobacteraceae bacterium]|nr:acyltransferase [Paracoccaceae bacterium]